MTIMVQLPGISGVGNGRPTRAPRSGAAINPARKASRQPASPPMVRRPAKMPLIPAMRPVNTISSTEASPINAPPTRPDTGSKGAMPTPLAAAQER